MFCKKCGYEFPDDENIRFCKRCGAPIAVFRDVLESTQVASSVETREKVGVSESRNLGTPTNIGDYKKKWVAIAIAALVVIAGIVLCIFFLLREKPDSEEIISEETSSFDPFVEVHVVFEGNNGQGTAKLEFDENREYSKGLKYSIKGNGSLSNGDTISVDVSYVTSEEEYLKEFNRKPSMLKKTYTVEGLIDTGAESENPEQNVMDEFIGKIRGVWECDDYYEFIDGNTIQRGWFESETLPDAYISDVKKLSDNRYEVSVRDDAHFGYDGQDYVAVYDGSTDDFSKTFTFSTDENEYTFTRVGNDMEEALDYYYGKVEKYALETADETHAALLEEYGIDPNTVEDYSQNLVPGEYKSFYSGLEDCYFPYPSKMFCDVNIDINHEEYKYGSHIKTVTFYGSKGSELSYSVYTRNDRLTIDDTLDALHSAEKNRFFDTTDILTSSDEEKGGRFVITGYANSSKEKLIYESVKVTDRFIYQMVTINPMYTSDEERLEYSYITENLYRMCTFSDSKKKPRSYEEYMEANN